MRDLQAFLIKRFIYILVLVTIAQSLISFLISQAVMPVVMKVFFPNYQRQSSVGKTDLFIFIICVLLLPNQSCNLSPVHCIIPCSGDCKSIRTAFTISNNRTHMIKINRSVFPTDDCLW